MPPRYFQGSSVKGDVRASDATSFKDVVDSFRICQTLPFTRASYFAMPEKEQRERKHVAFFTPACFEESPCQRITSKATTCNLIFLDIDPEKVKVDGKWVETGRYPAAPFVNDPDTLYTALGDLNFAAYTTASSTPEKPRMRIVVAAKDIPVARYPDAVATAARMLGLPSVTTESMVAVQPMFMPTLFKGELDVEPVIAHRDDARELEESDIEVGSAVTTRNGNSHNGTNGHSPKPHTLTCSNPTDALEFLRAAVPEITLAIAKEALSHIDPDCSYREWLEVAMALRHQFYHEDEAAYEIFDNWSNEGTKYGGPEETQAKWNSARNTPVGRLPVTIRSLLHYAVKGGWDDKRVKDRSFKTITDWMDEVESFTELMEKGIQKILGAPLTSAVQEGMLIREISRKAKHRFEYSVSISDLKKDVEKMKREIRSREASEIKTKEPKWCKGVCYVSAPGQFYRHKTGEKYRMDQFNATHSRELLPTEEQLRGCGLPVTPATLAKPIVLPNDYALNHIKVPAVYDYAYNPSQPTEMFFVDCGKKFVNTYSPTYPELESGKASKAGALFQRHLNNLILEPELRTTLTDFLAFQVQRPGEKIRWAVLVQGTEGCGKTYLAEVMKSVLGKEHVKTIDGSAIKSGWNDWAFGHQLVVLEEVRVAGTSRYEIMNALKPLITNDDISVNERFRNNRQTANISNYMMFSNHHDALAVTPGDRRYFIIKSPLQSKQQVVALGPDYFKPLFGMIADHPGAMRAYLHEWEISSSFSPDGHAPRTKYVQDLINDSASDLMATVRRLITEGDSPLIQFDIVSSTELQKFVQLESGLERTTAQQLSHVLREEGYTAIGRHVFGDERHYLWARSGVGGAVDAAQERFRTGAKNLCMELMF